jgi:DNA invertase Pin-like site-specific DNA recombinase
METERQEEREMSTIAIGYARLSPGDRKSEGQSSYSGISIEKQLDAIQNFVQYKNYSLVNIFIDDAVSGKNMDRPEFNKMNELIDTLVHVRQQMNSRKAKERDAASEILKSLNISMGKDDEIVLVFYKLDRLTRNLRDGVDYFESLAKNNVYFSSCCEGQEILSTKGAMGDFVRNILLIVAELERGMTSDRTKDVLHYLRDEGKVFCHNTPYGWTRQNKFLVPNETERQVILEFLQLKDSGLTWTGIANCLGAKGSRNERVWDKGRVHSLWRRMVRVPTDYEWTGKTVEYFTGRVENEITANGNN